MTENRPPVQISKIFNSAPKDPQKKKIEKMFEGLPKSREKTRWFYMNGSQKRISSSGGRANFRTFGFDEKARKISIQVVYIENEKVDTDVSIEWQFILEDDQTLAIIDTPILGGGLDAASRSTKSPQTLDVKSYEKIEVFKGNASSSPAVRFISKSAVREYLMDFVLIKRAEATTQVAVAQEVRKSDLVVTPIEISEKIAVFEEKIGEPTQ